MAEFSPLSGQKVRHRRKKLMRLRSVVGVVEIQVWHGQDSPSGVWGCPIRQRWRLEPHQQMSPTLQEKLVFTATLAGSFEDAAQLAAKWDCPVDDSVIHHLAQRVGARAEEQTEARMKQIPQESQPQRGPTELAVLMSDGWMARFRGPGWGRKKTKQERVEWHEIKTGVFYCHEQAATSPGSERGILSEKIMVRWQGEPLEFGRRLGWEALRAGLGRAQETLALADGGKWIWNLVEDRWPHARQLLDFFHASQHLNELALAVNPEEPAAQRWLEKNLHQLRHGQEEKALAEIAQLPAPRGERGEVVRKQKKYFTGQSQRMNYEERAARGWPIGSGAVESACRQSQCRFKRSGQFWTQRGFRHLNAIDEARRNKHWDELWLAA